MFLTKWHLSRDLIEPKGFNSMERVWVLILGVHVNSLILMAIVSVELLYIYISRFTQLLEHRKTHSVHVSYLYSSSPQPLLLLIIIISRNNNMLKSPVSWEIVSKKRVSKKDSAAPVERENGKLCNMVEKSAGVNAARAL